MVSQNDGPNGPKNSGKPSPHGPSPEDHAGIEASQGPEYAALFARAVQLGKAGDLKGAAASARKAITASAAYGGTHEAGVILNFLPALLSGGNQEDARVTAYRAAELLEDRPGCEYLLSNARFFTMQAELRADRKPAALQEAEACVLAGKASKTHCVWLATAWRYYGMLLALTRKMPEALLALSNAIDLAKSKPTDDPLALAKAYDVIGRGLLEMGKRREGLSSLRNALDEFRKHGARGADEAEIVNSLIMAASKKLIRNVLHSDLNT